MWAFFDRKVCLTTVESEWDIGYRELARVGLQDVIKFQSLPDIGPHQSFSRSERQILTDFHESGAETLLHLEDDVVFKALGHLGEALRELPSDWDIVYLGANIQCEPQRVSEHLFRVTNCWTTHAIGYNRKCIPFLLENQPPFSEMMFDNFLGAALGRLNAFIVAPMVAWQRPHYSTLWEKDGGPEFVDYAEVFTLSEARLI